jgi:predicted PurR-regulated permease PerM
MALDLAVIGIVFAIILLIIFFSAIVLYLSFRIKETFRKETRRGATIAKVAFLIGILFLAGGLFYFFANTFTNITEPSPTPTPTPTPSSTPTITPIPTPSQTSQLSLSVSAPSQTTMNSELSVGFTISNPTDLTFNGAYIETGSLFSDFTLQSSTHQTTGNVINIGDVASGVTIVNIELTSPNKAGTYSYTISLNFQDITNPVTKSVTIWVRGN